MAGGSAVGGEAPPAATRDARFGAAGSAGSRSVLSENGHRDVVAAGQPGREGHHGRVWEFEGHGVALLIGDGDEAPARFDVLHRSQDPSPPRSFAWAQEADPHATLGIVFDRAPHARPHPIKAPGAGPESDIDIAIELDETRHPTIYDYVGMQQAVSELFASPTDVVDIEAMQPRMRRRVEADLVDAF